VKSNEHRLNQVSTVNLLWRIAENRYELQTSSSA